MNWTVNIFRSDKAEGFFGTGVCVYRLYTEYYSQGDLFEQLGTHRAIYEALLDQNFLSIGTNSFNSGFQWREHKS